MEDFLKNRPVLDPKSALVLAAEPKLTSVTVKPVATTAAAPTAAASGAASPFADLRRDGPAGVTPTNKPPAKPGAAEPAVATAGQNLKDEHGTKVQTIVERGRVTKIIVTCSCGKVTEIACQY